MLDKLNITSDFINGLRVTDADTVSVVEMVLSGAINKSLVAAINGSGAKGVGISGKDADLIISKKLLGENKTEDGVETVDLGFVGEPAHIDISVINALIASDLIPVIAPVARGRMEKHIISTQIRPVAQFLRRCRPPDFYCLVMFLASWIKTDRLFRGLPLVRPIC